jgi:hypothetical protein
MLGNQHLTDFTKKISSNLDLKGHIYSLKLSNKDICGQIKTFLSLDEFPHLQLLTLIGVEQDDMKVLKTMLPLIPQLSSFHLTQF